MFVSLLNEYDYLKSLNKPEEIISLLGDKNINTKYLGLTSSGELINALKFLDVCQDSNIQPIIGLELGFSKYPSFNNVVLYAKNKDGYKFLNEIRSKELKFGNIGKILKQSRDIVFVFRNFEANFNPKTVSIIFEEMNENEFEDFFFSLEQVELVDIATTLEGEELSKFNSKLVNIISPRYPRNEDLESFIMLNALQNKTKYAEEKKNKYEYQKYSLEYLLSKQQNENYQSLYEMLDINTEVFLEKFEVYNLEMNYDITLNFEKFKKLDFEEIVNNKLNEYLQEIKVEDEAYSTDSVDEQAYVERLADELNVIKSMNFENYFLIMYDIVNYCQSNDILYGDGRGSAPGSLVSFLLRITKIDPIKYGLYFERFLNPKRVTIPDIDLDIVDNRRNEVVEYLVEEYGSYNVAKILTVNKYLSKSLVNEIGKSLEMDSNTLKKINKVISSRKSFEENIRDNYDFFNTYITNSKFDLFRRMITKLENTPKNSSIHAAGVIISAIDINQHSPVLEHVVQTEAGYLERFGYIKFDLLSLSTLTFLQKMKKHIDQIREEQGKPYFDLQDIPLDDPRVFANLSRGNTFGIFQLESEGITNLLKKYRPQNITDLGVVLALYRPGPMQNIDLFLENKENPSKINYIHPILKEVLKDTYGIIVFQEDVMNMVREVSNFNNEEADTFRYAISKKKDELLKSQKDKFIKQGLENGISEENLESIFENIETFANYGFNKAHAIAYASLIYKIMYIKTYLPSVFYNELFTSSINSQRRDQFLEEMNEHGIKIYSPNILKSNYEHRIKGRNILVGFKQIKGISQEKINKFIDLREEYLETLEGEVDLGDFLKNVFFLIDFNSLEKEALISAGVFSSFPYNMKTLSNKIIEYDDSINIARFTGEAIVFEEVDDYTFVEKQQKEEQHLGFNISYSPEVVLLKKFDKMYPGEKTLSVAPVIGNVVEYQNFFIKAKINKIKEIVTKNNDKMAFLSIEFLNKEYDVTCFPEEYKKLTNNGNLDEVKKGSMTIMKLHIGRNNQLIMDDMVVS